MTALRPFRIMLAVHDDSNLQAWVALAASLVREGGEIHLRGLITVPQEKSLSEATLQARQFRDRLQSLALLHPAVYDRTTIRVDYAPMEHTIDEIAALSIDLLLVEWMGPLVPTGGCTTDSILQQAECDVVLISGTGWQQVGDVLLSLRGGPNITLGTRVAKALAKADAITLFHAADRGQPIPGLQSLTNVEPQITRTVTVTTDIVTGLLEEAQRHKAIVFGASFNTPEIRHSFSSPIIKQIAGQTTIPLILVRTWHPERQEFHAPRRRQAVSETLSNRVDRWFAENTFHSHEFSDLQRLVALKEKQALTISVGLPALNEQETVGHVIQTLKKALMQDVPLVDEIVLIDSNSTDNTLAIARSLGVPVYKHPEILSHVGSHRGKGEALWKSLHVLQGDIIAWIDTDISNIHPRFIYGLLGPLLARPHLQYIKGFYQRPITINGSLHASGGGRVTELVARPLLNLFFPELSGIIQPLSGEYAGRRKALESIPFFSGYGVETGMLIDLHERYGLESIAQADLEERIHHNQALVGLSKMSFAILQVFIARLESRYQVSLQDYVSRSMKLIAYEPERFALDIVQIEDVERPPIITIPEYREVYA